MPDPVPTMPESQKFSFWETDIFEKFSKKKKNNEKKKKIWENLKNVRLPETKFLPRL